MDDVVIIDAIGADLSVLLIHHGNILIISIPQNQGHASRGSSEASFEVHLVSKP
jgi:hypothetical protein